MGSGNTVRRRVTMCERVYVWDGDNAEGGALEAAMDFTAKVFDAGDTAAEAMKKGLEL
ncbi:hypothetical protein N9L76_07860 [bacterium]|nr:hypothetical protein [bacterium]